MDAGRTCNQRVERCRGKRRHNGDQRLEVVVLT